MDRVILVGLSGTGKSSVARKVAGRLGYDVIDTDDEIVRQCQLSIPEIFARFGEPVFRTIEREVLTRACAVPRTVIATGGGVVLSEANWATMRPGSVIVHLTAEPEVLAARLAAQLDDAPGQSRPLLASGSMAERLRELWSARRSLYARADAAVDTTRLSPDQVAAAVVDAATRRDAAGLVPATSVPGSTGRSDVFVAPDLVSRLGELARGRWPEARRAWILTDANVGPIWSGRAIQALRDAGFGTECHVTPAGEPAKSLQRAGEVLDWLMAGRIDRRDVLVALGGGVIGDLGGFVASVALRGIGLAQVPTSLLAMVDSSVGGKTGVNHRLGKNLIGTFYQPHIVAADPVVLSTLPERERAAGWAEIVKHAMIERTATGASQTELLPLLERTDLAGASRDPALMTEIVRRNVRLKAAVVTADERESGPRRILNYGHTLGHAFEAADYRYLHGEAVALGLRAAAAIAARLGRCDPELVERQGLLLDRLGLPSRFEGSLERVMELATHDKKAVHGALTWVLPVAPGLVEVSRDVPLDTVAAVARELGAR